MQLVLVTRFLANLRYASPGDYESWLQSTQFTAPQFRAPTMQSAFGDLGQSLNFGCDEEDEYEDMLYGDTAVNSLDATVYSQA